MVKDADFLHQEHKKLQKILIHLSYYRKRKSKRKSIIVVTPFDTQGDFHSYSLRAFFAKVTIFAWVYRVASTMILYAQGSEENFQPEKFQHI